MCRLGYRGLSVRGRQSPTRQDVAEGNVGGCPEGRRPPERQRRIDGGGPRAPREVREELVGGSAGRQRGKTPPESAPHDVQRPEVIEEGRGERR